MAPQMERSAKISARLVAAADRLLVRLPVSFHASGVFRRRRGVFTDYSVFRRELARDVFGEPGLLFGRAMVCRAGTVQIC